tara:strand:- start:3457 stop:4098 length:642 start_codon:yes stop_codon:yes gene_type:complete
MGNNNKDVESAYMKGLHKKNKNSKIEKDVSLKDTDTEETKVKSYDYQRESIKNSKKREVVNTIAGLIDIDLDELEIFDTTQQVNDILTEKVKLALKNSNFLTLSKSIIRASLLQQTIAVRVSGSLLAPELYIYDAGFIFNSNKGDEDYIEYFQGNFTKSFGSGTSLVQERYDFYGDVYNPEEDSKEKGVFVSILQKGFGSTKFNPIVQKAPEI